MKRVFLSFMIEDRPVINGLRLLAANPNFDIEFYDESVKTPYNSENATYIKSQIREKISRASVTVAFVTALTNTSDWVNWEISESLAQGNTLICMGLPNGPQTLTLPPAARAVGALWYLWDLPLLTRLIGT